ncbi:hypothetical protein PIB30_012603 [Stylosanthes scabra]|uniref:FBD domain-containing protein n=1 Tax=Stylosanthes scabra TaxID=79078 RepID=A0ABU6X4G6_9FABA|nr:hypothetical protein [Stylosanthes scabra]
MSEFQSRVLDSHIPPQQQRIKTFSLNHHTDSSLFQPNQFNKWIRCALESPVEEIDVNVDLATATEMATATAMQVPLSVFTSENLRILKLQGEATLYSLYFPPCLPSLKVLSLKMPHRDATDLVSMLLLTSCCPVLEEFYFDGFCRTMRITAAPKLKKLVVNIESFESTAAVFEIDAPSLEYFSLKDMDPERYVVRDLGKVVEAEFSIMLDQRKSKACLFNLLQGLSSVKFLHINICYHDSLLPDSSTYLSTSRDYLPEFPNLIRLHFDGTSNLDLLPFFLRNSPKLETLIIETHSLIKDCLSSSLTNFTYKGLQGKEEEFERVKYISRNSSVLKTLKIQPDLSFKKKPRKERLRVSKELSMLPRGSQSCQFVFDQKSFFSGKGLQNVWVRTVKEKRWSKEIGYYGQ